jgi:L-alanine-DL-glutamate epimerase-like enolase superfamily enzyme
LARGREIRREESMRIKDIDIYYFDIPLQQPFKIAIGTMPAANNVLIRIHTNEDIMGLGESCPFPPITGETQETNIAVARNLRDMLLGRDPLAIEPFLSQAGSFLHSNPSIVAAFDMAFYDILGKVASLPLYRPPWRRAAAARD